MGEVAAQLYKQVTGVSLDGVMVVDPFVLQELLAFTGPIELNELSSTLTADNAAQFLLTDQYVVSGGEDARLDALGEAGDRVFEAFLEADIPDEQAVVDAFGPLVDERRLCSGPHTLMSRTCSAEPACSARSGPGCFEWMVGHGQQCRCQQDRLVPAADRLVPGDDRPGDRRIRRFSPGRAHEQRSHRGLPDYIIGNLVGPPPGHQQAVGFILFGDTASGCSLLDHEAVALVPGIERGWNVYSTYVDIPSEQTVVFELTFAGHGRHQNRHVDPAAGVGTDTCSISPNSAEFAPKAAMFAVRMLPNS